MDQFKSSVLENQPNDIEVNSNNKELLVEKHEKLNLPHFKYFSAHFNKLFKIQLIDFIN